MPQIMSNDVVRLVADLPELHLKAGDKGVVRSAWYYPNVAFEVEFDRDGESGGRLLLEDQVLPN